MAFDPHFIEAQLVLNRISSTDLPQVACDALEAGFDGPAIRKLAALTAPTFFEVQEILPATMAEMNLVSIDKDEAAIRLAKHRAKQVIASGDDPLKHARDFELLWFESDYCPKLSGVGNLDDEVYLAKLYSKQSEAEIREWVLERLKSFASS